jgi:transcriptional regulator of acetoin/glycerol metabolism
LTEFSDHAPPERTPADPGIKVQQFGPYISEEQQILEALRATGGNKAKAAKLLGIDRSTLYRKMQRYHF